MEEELYDVIVLGYGPVGQALALMLGQQGRSVAVCDRWPERYPLPRAVCIDHEIYRVLAANGMGALLPSISHSGPKYQWFDAQWEELLVIDWSAESISGGAEVNFVHQPTLERALSDTVATLTNVHPFLGWEAIAIDQDESRCDVTLRSEAGKVQQLAGRFVIGCDGANSMVRAKIGGTQEDRGFQADWLVIDVLLREGVTIEQLGIPAAGQYCNPTRPTTIVPAGIRNGKIFRRWEFMLLPGESPDEIEREERIWELLRPWAGPDSLELVRSKVYTFRSLLARTWRDQRLLLAGDAAHVMPPFMGQGMCAGIRDAWNLTWKLGLILDGKSNSSLLESYQAERMPHVSQIIDMSIYLGKLICMPDPGEAEKRDLAFRTGAAPPPPDFPHLTDGILHRVEGSIANGAGLLSPHVSVAMEDAQGRLDDLAGLGFLLVSTGQDPQHTLGPDALRALRAVGMSFLPLAAEGATEGIVDLDGKLKPFMHRYGWDAMIVRPDFYIFGGASGETNRSLLVEDFLKSLQAAGISAVKSPVRVHELEHWLVT